MQIFEFLIFKDFPQCSVMLTLSDSLTTNSDSKMTAILDQKHYIEELNRHLSCTVTDLQAKMDSLEKTNSKLIEEVKTLYTKILSHCFLWTLLACLHLVTCIFSDRITIRLDVNALLNTLIHFRRWFEMHSRRNQRSVNLSGCRNQICEFYYSQNVKK